MYGIGDIPHECSRSPTGRRAKIGNGSDREGPEDQPGQLPIVACATGREADKRLRHAGYGTAEQVSADHTWRTRRSGPQDPSRRDAKGRAMHELRLMAVSEDGTYLVLSSTGHGTRFMLPVDDRLRAAVRGQFSRLGQYEIEVENPLRPKEIQSRIRSGETAEDISEISGIPIERVRWFEGPIRQERDYIAQQAQQATVRAQEDAAPGATLEELVVNRIGAHQLETGEAVWDSWRREDRTWCIKLVFLHHGEEHLAHWLYEPKHNSVTPADEEAARFSFPEPPERSPSPGATITPFSPRRGDTGNDTPRMDARSAAEQRPDHAAARPLSSARGSHADEPLRPAPRRPETDRFGVPIREDRPRPAQGRRASERPHGAEQPEPGEVSRPARLRRTEPELEESSRAEPTEIASGPTGRPDVEPAPPAAKTPTPQNRPRRRRATIDLNDTGTPRRAADQSSSSSVPADGGDRPAPKRKGRGRRASVPSWDEIMFGSKKDE